MRGPANAGRIHAAELEVAERAAGDLGTDRATHEIECLLEIADEIAHARLVRRHLRVEEVALEEVELAAQLHAQVGFGNQRFVVYEMRQVLRFLEEPL